MIPLWVGAALIGALAQTGRNATQAGLTKAIGTIGATQVRFLFGLPFVVAFLVLVSLWTGEALPSLTSATLGWTLIGGLAQIAGTALMLQVMKSMAFGVTTAWLKIEPVTVALIGLLLLGDPVTLPILLAILIAVLGVVILTLKPGQGRAMFVQAGPAAMGLLAGVFFGLAAIGFRGGIVVFQPTSGRTMAPSSLPRLSGTGSRRLGQRPPTSSRDHPGRTDTAKVSPCECATSC